MSVDRAVARGIEMVAEGAAIIDVGGESTRPGSATVSVEEELRRVVPVIEALSQEISVPISIDTSKPEIMRRAVAAGAGMINDVTALRAVGALETARDAGVPVCLMHMQGEPGTMQAEPRYEDAVFEVNQFLRDRVEACEQAGIPRRRLVLDPGFGFGKTVEHNLTLLAGLDRLVENGLPVLVGLSRKSLIGKLLGDAPVERRLYGSLALAVMAAIKGARRIRVHDVRPTFEALSAVLAVLNVNGGSAHGYA